MLTHAAGVCKVISQAAGDFPVPAPTPAGAPAAL
jgi:hypothetical protein